MKIIVSGSPESTPGEEKLIWGLEAVFAIVIPVKTRFRPKRILTNVPAEGVVYLRAILFGSHAAVSQKMDAFMASQRKFLKEDRAVTRWDEEGGIELDGPILEPSDTIQAFGKYTGLIPPHNPCGHPFDFVLSVL